MVWLKGSLSFFFSFSPLQFTFGISPWISGKKVGCKLKLFLSFMFVRPNGFRLITASFHIIYIQPLKLICIYPGYILISFVTIYTAQKRILHAFFSLALSIFNRASAVENPFICCWVLVQVIWWIQLAIFHFLTKQPDVYINFFSHVMFAWAKLVNSLFSSILVWKGKKYR